MTSQRSCSLPLNHILKSKNTIIADDDHKSGGGVPILKDIEKVHDWRQQIGLYIMGKYIDPGVVSMTDE